MGFWDDAPPEDDTYIEQGYEQNDSSIDNDFDYQGIVNDFLEGVTGIIQVSKKDEDDD